MIKNKLRLLNEEINVEDDKIYPTHDADINFIEFLRNATIFGLDDEGNEIPGYIFVNEITEMFGIGAEETIEFAREHGYIIYIAKVLGEELPADMYVICAEGCDTQLIKDDFKEIHEVEIELELVEDEEDTLEEVASLDKEERMRLHLLIQKYGRPDNELDEAREELTSVELKNKIDGIITKQIPEVETRITKYRDEQSKTKNDKVVNTLNNKIRQAEKQIKELQKRKETLEIDLIAKKEAEEKKIRDEVDEKIRQQITPGKGKRSIHKKLIPTPEQKEAYKDIVKFLQDNAVSIRLEVAEKKVNTIRNVIPGIQDNQFKVISGVGDSGYDKKWGISGVITVKNIELLPDNLRHEFFKGGNTITEIVPIASILNSGFDELEDKITLYDEDGKSYKEDTTVKENKDNELRARARRHKKTDKKGAHGWFVNKDAGDVEHNIAVFNRISGGSTSTADGGIGTTSTVESVNETMIEALPQKGESKVDFVARFMSEMADEYENPKQRYAVALQYWEKKDE